MALTLGDNFSYGGSKPLDARLKYATLADMKAVADATMYDGCLAYCVATDKTYQWKSTNTVDADTGKWREFSSGGGADPNAYHTTDSAETTMADDDKVPFYDTSATASKNSTWSNIKSVLKTYFDTLYSTVKTRGTAASGGTALSLVNTGDMYTWNNKQNAITAGANLAFTGNTLDASYPVMGVVSKSDLYDTTEKVVGKWTDGRPVYQKCVYVPNLPNTTSLDVLHGITNLNQIIEIKGYATNSSGTTFPIPNSQNEAAATNPIGISIYALSNKTAFRIVVGNDRSSYSAYVTLKYTKTTDAANSFKYADENDYSTSETIVGKWIDGKPVYQKTYSFTMGTSEITNVATLSNVRVVANLKAICNWNTNSWIPIPYASASGGSVFHTYIFTDNNVIKIACTDTDLYNKQCYATIQYVKTTD